MLDEVVTLLDEVVKTSAYAPSALGYSSSLISGWYLDIFLSCCHSSLYLLFQVPVLAEEPRSCTRI